MNLVSSTSVLFECHDRGGGYYLRMVSSVPFGFKMSRSGPKFQMLHLVLAAKWTTNVLNLKEKCWFLIPFNTKSFYPLETPETRNEKTPESSDALHNFKKCASQAKQHAKLSFFCALLSWNPLPSSSCKRAKLVTRNELINHKRKEHFREKKIMPLTSNGAARTGCLSAFPIKQ